MFDRTAYSDPGRLAAQPYVSIEALVALFALLDFDAEGSNAAALLSGASRASHHQNRGEIHVTRDDKLRERILTQSTIAPAASERSVWERPVERRHRAPEWSELTAQARAALTSLLIQLILGHVATAATPRANEVDYNL
jgi:hypothetical protein